MITAITMHILNKDYNGDVFQIKGILGRLVSIYASMAIDICLASIAWQIAF